MNTRRHRVDVFLAPGELAVHAGPINIKTIVGSCVAVCLWDPQRRIAGVNHYLLPHPNGSDVADTRFGSIAMKKLIERVCSAGATRERLQASVIGGGSPLDAIKFGSVGEQNVNLALAVLRENGIRVIRQETGGAHGRKLLFNAQTGDLLVRRVRGWAESQSARTGV